MKALLMISVLGAALGLGQTCLDKNGGSIYTVWDCGTNKASTGFLIPWREGNTETTRIVTVLHAIESCPFGQRVDLSFGSALVRPARPNGPTAAIDAVNAELDLALLKPDTGQALGPPLVVDYQVARNQRSDAGSGEVLGYPHSSRVLSSVPAPFINNGKLLAMRDYFGGYFRDSMARVPDPGTLVLGLSRAVQPGESGGPVLNARCQVQGVVNGGWMIDARPPGGIHHNRVGADRSYAIPFPAASTFKTGQEAKAKWSEARGKLHAEPIRERASGASDGILVRLEDQRRVYLMQKEVTQGDFLAVCGGQRGRADLCRRPGGLIPGQEHFPITDLSGDESEEVCRRLYPTLNGRVPTWAEWSEAARAHKDRSAARYNLSLRKNQRTGIESLDPGIVDELGFVNFFGNVFEVVLLPNGKFAYVGGSFATRPERLGLLPGLPSEPQWHTQVSGAEVGLRCAFEAGGGGDAANAPGR